MSINDPFWDTFEELPLTPEAQAAVDKFERDADRFDAAWDRAIVNKGGQL